MNIILIIFLCIIALPVLAVVVLAFGYLVVLWMYLSIRLIEKVFSIHLSDEKFLQRRKNEHKNKNHKEKYRW